MGMGTNICQSESVLTVFTIRAYQKWTGERAEPGQYVVCLGCRTRQQPHMESKQCHCGLQESFIKQLLFFSSGMTGSATSAKYLRSHPSIYSAVSSDVPCTSLYNVTFLYSSCACVKSKGVSL